MAAVRQEIIELANAFTAPIGDSPAKWAATLCNEAVDVVAVVVAACDDVNRESDLARIRGELVAAAQEVAAHVEIPLGLGAILPILAGALVDKLGAYTGGVERFKTEYLLPIFTEIESFGHRGRVVLMS